MGLFTKADDEKKIVTDEQTHENGKASHHDPDDPDYHEAPMTFREKLRELLHSQKFQIVVIALVVFDCILVIGELILDFEALAAAKGCSLEGGNSSESGYESPYYNTYKNETQDPYNDDAHVEEEEEHEESPTKLAAEAFHIMSLIILSIFMIELALKVFALGAKFFHSKLEVFDAIVIVTSFILDIVTLIFPEQFAVLDLIVVLRLWRILRIVNGVVLSVEQQAEKKIHHHKKLKRRALYILRKFETYSEALEEEIEALRGLLNANKVEIDEGMIKNKPVKPHYDRKLHLDTMEDGKVDHHGMSAMDSQIALDWTQDPVYGESSQPPDYASTLQEA
ncbi:voltage-gated hydrogen channel 1-like isoform X2 [Asterias rubens]|nr:voltage-gated hydrogen channel 1-like isoform X2 [Asterias rubens]